MSIGAAGLASLPLGRLSFFDPPSCLFNYLKKPQVADSVKAREQEATLHSEASRVGKNSLEIALRPLLPEYKIL